ncbi:hypothetical protein K7X08_029308 [Anisodus acutangulus]|uniref:AT-hook motif nuclear-localized protein n=1 Tax=Anisodus acutangulus TaxID=402998 RepID=A0A9Q1L0K5_9SOLA|nr:hypothetical protein K7X08_029308 [Anisodus acutangulus]
MEGSNSGVTVVGSDYHVAPSTTTTSQVVVVSPTPATAITAGLSVKKKRGRPRKYAPDGSVNVLSPKPISSSAPAPSPVIYFSSSEKRGKIRQVGLVSKPQFHQPKVDLDTPGEWVSCSVGANFTPHIITVKTGEDVTMKVISFSQQGPRAICILSANGVVSSVTLRQPDSSGGTLTYEGRFEILSLTGSFMPSETGGMRNRSGGMSVSLASPDGRVVGGGISGLLVAAGPVQIVIGSFLAGDQHEQITKKNKSESVIAAVPLPEMEDPYHSSAKQTIPASSSFRVDNWQPPILGISQLK